MSAGLKFHLAETLGCTIKSEETNDRFVPGFLQQPAGTKCAVKALHLYLVTNKSGSMQEQLKQTHNQIRQDNHAHWPKLDMSSNLHVCNSMQARLWSTQNMYLHVLRDLDVAHLDGQRLSDVGLQKAQGRGAK